jgi:crotonobetainyl-CoA:carnitine CoA-transferase CaiB-like acyl-CoA transferase
VSTDDAVSADDAVSIDDAVSLPAVGPLAGVRILDLTSVVMGPLATQILGDLGADVITVEAAQGDIARIMGAGPRPDLSGTALNLLRNKRNIDLDIKAPAGHDALMRIAATCDVVVTNLRPGPAARAGVSYEDIRAVRPDVVYCQAHGFPSDGPRAAEPAYDDIIQSASGVADAARRTTGAPSLAPTILMDKVCGLTIAYAVSAALFARERTGLGEHIEVPMVDTAIAFMLVEHGAGAIPCPPLAPAGYGRILTPERRPAQTADGWIGVLCYSREHYDTLFAAGGRHDLLGDERYATGPARIANSTFLYREVAAVLRTGTTERWLAFCREHSIPATAVADLDDLVDALPEAEHPITGRYKTIPHPVRFARRPASVRRHAPLVGQHTEEILREVGLTGSEIAGLAADGITGGRTLPA